MFIIGLTMMSVIHIMYHRRIGHAGYAIDTVEHIIISHNEEDQSYGIEGEV